MSKLSPNQAQLVRRWWQYATEDLYAAEALIQNPPFVSRHICTFAQQAAEKALKSALVFEQIDFPKSHDLDALRNLLPKGWSVKQALPQLRQLTNWAIEARYPIYEDDPVDKEAEEATALARSIWQSIYQDLLNRGFDSDSY